MTPSPALRHAADAPRTGEPEHDEASLAPTAERGAGRAFLRALFRYAPRRAASALGLLVLQGATEGIGILLLVPFLILVGQDAGEVPQGSVADVAVRAFETVGAPLTLVSVLAAFVALILLRALCLYVTGVLRADIQLGFTDRLRTDLFGALGRSRWRFLVSRRLSDVVHGITQDVGRVSAGTRYALDLLSDGVVALAYVVVAIRLSLATTAIALALGALLEILRWPLVRRARELGRATTTINRNAFAILSEFVAGLKPIKSRGLEGRHRQAYDETIRDIREQRLGFTRSLLRAQVLHQVAVAASLSVLLYVAATALRVPTAELLVLVFVFARLMPVLAGLHQSYRSMIEMAPAFASANALLAAFEEAAEPTPEEGGRRTELTRELRLDGVSLRYEGGDGRPALDQVDLVLLARRTFGIVGPSGAGKSTLADVILGLLAPDEGRVSVDGEELDAGRRASWRSSVAYLPQETFLLHDTVRANLAWMMPEATEEEMWEALRLAAAEGFVKRLPAGLDTVLGDRGTRISGGERQRVALARALLCRPQLLILDEATSHIDRENERQILRAIENLHGRMTVVIVTHRPSTVKNADRIVLLEEGRVVDQGGWDELRTDPDGRLARWLASDAPRQDPIGA